MRYVCILVLIFLVFLPSIPAQADTFSIGISSIFTGGGGPCFSLGCSASLGFDAYSGFTINGSVVGTNGFGQLTTGPAVSITTSGPLGGSFTRTVNYASGGQFSFFLNGDSFTPVLSGILGTALGSEYCPPTDCSFGLGLPWLQGELIPTWANPEFFNLNDPAVTGEGSVNFNISSRGIIDSGSLDVSFEPVPEPATLMLLSSGLVSIVFVLRKR